MNLYDFVALFANILNPVPVQLPLERETTPPRAPFQMTTGTLIIASLLCVIVVLIIILILMYYKRDKYINAQGLYGPPNTFEPPQDLYGCPRPEEEPEETENK